MKKKLLASVLALSLLLPTQAFANENDIFEDLELPAGQVDLKNLPIEFQEKFSQRSKEINAYFEKLEELKIEVELAKAEVLGQNTVGIVSFNVLSNLDKANSDLEYYESNSIEIVGLEKLKIEEQSPLIQPLSTRTQVETSKPTIYYDNDTLSYVVSSGWNWNQINPDIDNRGRDGFGINIVQEMISVFDTQISTWDYNGSKYSPSLSPEVSSYGYHLTFDDYSNGKTYSAHRGSSWMFFRFYNAKPVGKTVNFNAQYNHTWSGVNITSVTVGSSSVGLSFSSGNNWTSSEYSAIKF